MLRLGLLTHNFPIHPEKTSDAGSFVASLATMLQGPDCEVAVFCQSLGCEVSTPPGVKIYQFPWSGQGHKLGNLRLTRFREQLKLVEFVRNGREGVLRFIRDYGIEYCLAVWVMPAGYFAYYARKKLGVPYTVWALGSDINRYYRFGLRRLSRKILQEANQVFADGPDLVKKVNAITEDSRCRFLASSRPLNTDRERQFSEIGKRFLFVGRLEEVKGIDLLLRAFREVVKSEADATLEVIGTGSLESDMSDFVRCYNLEQHVLLRGSATTGQLKQAYQRNDCLVIPSRSESLPLVFSEAMQFQLPVIVTDVGDMKYFVETYHAGTVVTPESIEALRQGMESFIQGKTHWSLERMGHAAKYLSLERSVAEIKAMIGVHE